MKKLLGIIALVFVLCSSAFAIDTVKVVRAGKATNTQTPIFSEITVSSINYTYTGETTSNTVVVVAGLKSLTSATTTASITNLGKALNTQGYAITGGSAITAGAISGTTGAFSSLVSIGNSPNITTWSGVASFNYAITVTANGKLVTIPVML